MDDITMGHSVAQQKERLVNDLRVVIADAEQLLRTTAGDVGDQGAEMRSRMLARLAEARRNLGALQQSAVTRVREAGVATDGFVRDHPWTAVGAATGVGMLLGAGWSWRSARRLVR